MQPGNETVHCHVPFDRVDREGLATQGAVLLG